MHRLDLLVLNLPVAVLAMHIQYCDDIYLPPKRPCPVPDGKFAFLARAADYVTVQHLKGKLVLDKKHRCLLAKFFLGAVCKVNEKAV